MLLLTIEKKSATPVYRQICEHIVGLVDAGTLAPGDRLPPTRVLARTLGVHRTTVLRAYEELWALGYLESRPGSYSTVRRRARPIPASRSAGEGIRDPRGGAPPQPAPAGRIDWQAVCVPTLRSARDDVLRAMQESARAAGVIDFARLAADPELAPRDDIQSCLRAAMLRHGRELLDYGDAMGYPPLREAIAARMRTHGVEVSADEILVTSGAQHALDLVLRALTRPGDRVATESPTYGMAISLFRFHGLALLEVPMRDEGMDLEMLAAMLEREPAALVYTVPNFQNPTGITTSQAHRERLLSICEARRVPIVEDGFEEEMKYFGMAVLPIKSMDAHGIDLYLGTFSKVVFPGLRIGWIAAPRAAIERLVAVQWVSMLAGNSVAQAAAARFCSTGAYEAHLRRVHRVYRRRMQAMLQAMRAHMPEGVAWTQPAGGYTLWMRLPHDAADERALCEHLQRNGVKAAPGSGFFAHPPATLQLRLSISCVPEADIPEGCRRLGRALASFAGTVDRRPTRQG